ncbi:MAG: hypothetical protein HYR74_00585, partial [Candidatus Eisenbacteria bacterium]|nr:hypothetical protein [Candidatus Eisenbacteria bacterium]
ARALPAGELLAAAGDWAALEPLARDEVAACAALGMLHEEAWARLLLARAAFGLGRRDEAAREAAVAAEACAHADLRGMRWRGTLWLAETLREGDAAAWSAAAEALERFLEGLAGDERTAWIARAGDHLARWRDRARAAGAEAAAGRFVALASPPAGRGS